MQTVVGSFYLQKLHSLKNFAFMSLIGVYLIFSTAPLAVFGITDLSLNLVVRVVLGVCVAGLAANAVAHAFFRPFVEIKNEEITLNWLGSNRTIPYASVHQIDEQPSVLRFHYKLSGSSKSFALSWKIIDFPFSSQALHSFLKSKMAARPQ
jgi:hypothetical protein